MRPQCSVFIATSLDGFIARPDGRIDWLSLVERAGEDYGYKAFFESIDTLVIGRNAKWTRSRSRGCIGIETERCRCPSGADGPRAAGASPARRHPATAR